MKLKVLLLAALLSSACCSNPTPKGGLISSFTPPQLNLIQALTTPSGFGLMAPISPTQALTAAHMVATEGQIQSYDGRLWHVQWVNHLRDIAMLHLADGQPESKVWLLVSTKRPRPTELLWMKAYFGFNSKNEVTIAPIVGHYITIDVEKNMLLDAWSYGGMSGGGVMNAQGELVGIVTATVFPAASEGRHRALLQAADLTGGIR